MNTPRQRGVALIAALLAVALAIILMAALLDNGETARARTRHTLRAEQSWQLMRGLEAWAAQILRQDSVAGDGIDSHGDTWAQPLPAIEIPGARISGQLRDLGGCLNLNSLWREGADGALAVNRFERLLRVLGLDPLIAQRTLDWIDADVEARAGGAEDAYYSALTPPYRTANRPLAHLSELRLVRGIDAKTYTTLAPHVCALPADQKLNLNTASLALWRSLDDRISEAIATRLYQDGQAHYRTLEDIRTALNREGLPNGVLEETAVTSDYFLAEADILADGLPFRYSLLLRREPGRVRTLARIRGRF